MMLEGRCASESFSSSCSTSLGVTTGSSVYVDLLFSPRCAPDGHLGGASDDADHGIGEVGSCVVDGVSGVLPGLLQRLVACADEPSRLLSIGEMGRCEVVDAAVPRRRNPADVAAVMGGEASWTSVVGTSTREMRLARSDGGFEPLLDACG